KSPTSATFDACCPTNTNVTTVSTDRLDGPDVPREVPRALPGETGGCCATEAGGFPPSRAPQLFATPPATTPMPTRPAASSPLATGERWNRGANSADPKEKSE